MGQQDAQQLLPIFFAAFVEFFSFRAPGRVVATERLSGFLKVEVQAWTASVLMEWNRIMKIRVGRTSPKSRISLPTAASILVLFTVVVSPWLTTEPTPQPTLMDVRRGKPYQLASAYNDTPLIEPTFAVARCTDVSPGRPRPLRSSSGNIDMKQKRMGMLVLCDGVPESTRVAHIPGMVPRSATKTSFGAIEVPGNMVWTKQDLLDSIPATIVDVSVLHVMGATIVVGQPFSE